MPPRPSYYHTKPPRKAWQLTRRLSRFTKRWNTMLLPLTQAQLKFYETSARPLDSLFPWLTLDERCFLLFGATPEEFEAFLSAPTPTASKELRK